MDITGKNKKYGTDEAGKGDSVVLVVNDDSLLRKQVCLLLQEAGYTVVPALDGCEALELAARTGAEIVISDVNMPNMDGIELCRRLRRDERFGGVPILLVSAERKDSWSAEAGMRAGADDYIEIPFDNFKFMAKVMRLIARHQSEKELRLANAELEERVRERMAELSLMNTTLRAQVADFRQAERALRESEARFKSLFDDAPMAYHELDSAGRITRVNQTWQRLFGYEAAEVEGRPIWEFVAESVSREVVLRKLSGDAPSHAYERTFLRKDGTHVPVLVEDRLIRDGLGEVMGIRTTLLDATQRKLAEDALKESERKYRLLMEQASDGIVVYDLEGRILEVNQQFCDLLGCSHAELLGMRDLDHYTALDPAEPGRVEQLQAGETLITERILQCKDGRRYTVEISTKMIDGASIQSIVRDVTERYCAEEALRRQGRLMQALMDSSPDAIYFKDTEGRFIHANRHVPYQVNYPCEEVVGKTDFDFFVEEHARAAYEDEQRIMRTGWPVIDKEEMEIYPDGSTTWLSTTKVPVYDDDGRVMGIAGISRDITERKRAEAELRRSENALRLVHEDNERLLGVLPSIIIGIDSDGCVTRANRVAETTLDIREEEVVGKTVDDCGINWDSERLFHIISDSMAQVSVSRLPDIKYTRRDGREGVLGLTAIPFEGAGSSKFGMLLYGADITERRKLEGQFRQAQKLESIGQLAAGIAHEINTPTQYVGDNCRFLQDAFSDLTGAFRSYAGLAEAAKSGPGPAALHVAAEEATAAAAAADIDYLVEEVPRAIDQALEGVERIAEIVRSMKEFAHPGPAERRAADLNRAIESTVTVARNEWKYVAEVALDLDATLPAVPCMVGEINQVVLNLIVNAAHAVADKVGDGSRGKGQITVATRREDDWAVVRVSDTGVGIPERLRGRIFDPFFTTKEVGKGTGQGLAIAHGVIVEKHEGEIGFETEEGVGTTFTVRLPLTEVSRESSRDEALVA